MDPTTLSPAPVLESHLPGRGDIGPAGPAPDHRGGRHHAQRPRPIEVAGEHVHQALAPELEAGAQGIERCDRDEIGIQRRAAAQPGPPGPGAGSDRGTGQDRERGSPQRAPRRRRRRRLGRDGVGQRPREFRGGLETIRRVLGQGGLDRGPEPGGNRRSAVDSAAAVCRSSAPRGRRAGWPRCGAASRRSSRRSRSRASRYRCGGRARGRRAPVRDSCRAACRT